MAASHSGALVIFGVAGDLARKMIFPALYAMVKRGTLQVPVIGVALPRWSPERLHKRVTDSIERAGGADNQGALNIFCPCSGMWAAITRPRTLSPR
jgi:glucose-6-phosphate 1-dehydrogenase